MQVRVKTPEGIKLEYKTSGACAFDLQTIDRIDVAPGAFVMIETGVVVEVPEGYTLLLAPRSSTFKNYGLMMVNSVGVIDQDYRGDNDTIKVVYINMRSTSVTIEKGERIAQAMFVCIAKPELVYVEKMGEVNRGGFGTTGNI